MLEVAKTDKDALAAAKKSHPDAESVLPALDAPLDDVARLFYLSGIAANGMQIDMIRAATRQSPLALPRH